MKRLISLLLAAVLLFALSACRTSEKKAEKAIENAIGGDAKVNIDGDKYSVEYDDGQKVEFGDKEWPTGEVADIIPKFDKGSISSVVSMTGVCIIDVDDVSQKDFDAYLQAVKDAGFTQDAMDFNESDASRLYMAGADGGKSITLTYTAEEKHLQITGGLSQ